MYLYFLLAYQPFQYLSIRQHSECCFHQQTPVLATLVIRWYCTLHKFLLLLNSDKKFSQTPLKTNFLFQYLSLYQCSLLWNQCSQILAFQNKSFKGSVCKKSLFFENNIFLHCRIKSNNLSFREFFFLFFDFLNCFWFFDFFLHFSFILRPLFVITFFPFNVYLWTCFMR